MYIHAKPAKLFIGSYILSKFVYRIVSRDKQCVENLWERMTPQLSQSRSTSFKGVTTIRMPQDILGTDSTRNKSTSSAEWQDEFIKNSPKCSPTNFLPKLMHKLNRGKKQPSYSDYFCNAKGPNEIWNIKLFTYMYFLGTMYLLLLCHTIFWLVHWQQNGCMYLSKNSLFYRIVHM
jgi:hypothetical protein